MLVLALARLERLRRWLACAQRHPWLWLREGVVTLAGTVTPLHLGQFNVQNSLMEVIDGPLRAVVALNSVD